MWTLEGSIPIFMIFFQVKENSKYTYRHNKNKDHYVYSNVTNETENRREKQKIKHTT